MIQTRSTTHSMSPDYSPPAKPISITKHVCFTSKCSGSKKRTLQMIIDIPNKLASIECSECHLKTGMMVVGQNSHILYGATPKRVMEWWKESLALVCNMKDELIKEGWL